MFGKNKGFNVKVNNTHQNTVLLAAQEIAFDKAR